MAVRCVLDRIFGIRVRLKWDSRKQEVWFAPDEDDMKSVPIVSLLKYSAAVDAWSRDFLSRHQGWKIDGQSTPEDEDEIDVDSELAMPMQERSQGEGLLSETSGTALSDSELLGFFGRLLANE